MVDVPKLSRGGRDRLRREVEVLGMDCTRTGRRAAAAVAMMAEAYDERRKAVEEAEHLKMMYS